MPTRTDIRVDWTQSPRRIEVLAPSVEVSAQDLYDTLRDLEDDMPNISRRALVSAAGKEDLGGGATASLTICLHDAQLIFLTGEGAVVDGGIVAVDRKGADIPPVVPLPDLEQLARLGG